MKRFIAVLAALVVALALAGCTSGSGVPEGFEEAEVLAAAEQAVRLLSEQDYEGVAAMFAPVMELDAEGLEAAVGEIISSLGPLEEVVSRTTRAGGDRLIGVYAVAVLGCEHQNGSAVYTVSVDSNGEICGFYVR